MKMNLMKRWLALACLVGGIAPVQAVAPDEYYSLETISFPEELKLEVSGMALLPDGNLAIAIRKGEIWILSHPTDGQERTYRRFASGLHEPLGLAWRDGAFYTVQRTELTRIRDLDQDGVADEYWTVSKPWGVTGSYHEYAYGPAIDSQGRFWITLNTSIGKGPVPEDDAWRGWSILVQPDGSWEPVSGGFRSPSGLGFNLEGDLFATDQQGNWFPTCPLMHVRKGAFHGHADSLPQCSRPEATFQVKEPLPTGLTVVEAAERIPAYKLPPVWFPYRTMGMSATDVLCDSTEGGFGPFEGQLFVGEFTMSQVNRVFLEKVDGEYQGACFPFVEGLQCAALRLAWGADGSLFIGESNRGWNSLGDRSYGLQRLTWSRKTPFEMKEVHATPKGFRIVWTLPADPKSLQADMFAIRSYTYPYHKNYGGDELEEENLKITAARPSKDGLSLELEVEGLRAGYVHEIRPQGVRSLSKLPLRNPLACYTLNRIPKP